jgi:hypothetical protein
MASATNPEPIVRSPTFWITSTVRAPPSRAPHAMASASSSWVARIIVMLGSASMAAMRPPIQLSGTPTPTRKPRAFSVSKISRGRPEAGVTRWDSTGFLRVPTEDLTFMNNA